MSIAPVEDIDAKITDPQFYAGLDFHELFAYLRANDPVHWTEGNYERGYWSLSRYDDCVAVLEQPILFSNRAWNHLPPSGREMTEKEKEGMGVDVHILLTDPPAHTKRRRPMNKHMSVPVISHLRPMFEGIAHEILDEAEAKNEIDIVEDVAALMPVKVILRLLGVPDDDWAKIRDFTTKALLTQDGEYIDEKDDGLAVTAKYIAAVNEYLLGLIRDRRVNPTEDYATIIAQLQDSDGLLSEQEASYMAVGFVLGGLEGTRNALSVGTYELLQNPDQAELLRRQPDLAKSAVEEILRWSTPSKNRLRVATEDTVIGDKQIKAGDWVVAWTMSANRDEAVFENPDMFDIARTPNKHLSFGLGAHTCLGRAMARLEMEILIPLMLERFPGMTLNGTPEWLVSDNATGLKRLPVRLKP